MKHIFKARHLYHFDSCDNWECVFRVDHVRWDNKILNITQLAHRGCDTVRQYLYVKEINDLTVEITKKDFPLYIGWVAQDEFAELLKGSKQTY